MFVCLALPPIIWPFSLWNAQEEQLDPDRRPNDVINREIVALLTPLYAAGENNGWARQWVLSWQLENKYNTGPALSNSCGPPHHSLHWSSTHPCQTISQAAGRQFSHKLEEGVLLSTTTGLQCCCGAISDCSASEMMKVRAEKWYLSPLDRYRRPVVCVGVGRPPPAKRAFGNQPH